MLGAAQGFGHGFLAERPVIGGLKMGEVIVGDDHLIIPIHSHPQVRLIRD